MNMEIGVMISIAGVAWSGGLFIGMFTSRFVQKRECESCRKALWDAIDGIKDAMMGGTVRFELRMIRGKEAE